MAGPIQTAISQALTAASVGVGVGSKINEDARQVSQNRQAAENEAKEQARADYKEARSVAFEADLRGREGVSAVSAKAYRLAKERGLSQDNRILYDEKGEPVATYGEMAKILADTSLSDTLSSKINGRDAVKVRKQMLEGKTHEERIQNAILAKYGEGGLKHGKK